MLQPYTIFELPVSVSLVLRPQGIGYVFTLAAPENTQAGLAYAPEPGASKQLTTSTLSVLKVVPYINITGIHHPRPTHTLSGPGNTGQGRI